MGLFERVIRALIYLCFIALMFYLCVFVLEALGIILPYMIMNILKVIFVLVAILILVRLFYPVLQGQNWFGDRQ
jgi:hypothetical protein